jgi:hypothetical protein
MSEPHVPHDFDALREALEAAGAGKTVNGSPSALQRLWRVASGEQAVPAAADYVTAVRATDGAVCIALKHDADILFRGYDAVPDADTDYQRLDDMDDGDEETILDVPSVVVSNWVATHGAELRLYDQRVAERFADANHDVLEAVGLVAEDDTTRRDTEGQR